MRLPRPSVFKPSCSASRGAQWSLHASRPCPAPCHATEKRLCAERKAKSYKELGRSRLRLGPHAQGSAGLHPAKFQSREIRCEKLPERVEPNWKGPGLARGSSNKANRFTLKSVLCSCCARGQITLFSSVDASRRLEPQLHSQVGIAGIVCRLTVGPHYESAALAGNPY